jgi:hypothetical protein
MAENEGDQGVYDSLINNLNIVILPVLNIDGFLQTQRFPDQARQTTYANDPQSWPRDGRMRRKNMRGVDEDLSTAGDTLGGVDLNRNNNPYWASSDRSSSEVGSLTHHGISAGSEPESRALYAAAELGPAERLRFYIDTHSYSQLWYMPNTENERRNAIANRAATRMRIATNNTYQISPSNAGVGIGTTAEYHANTYQIPSYTLEIEPGNDAGAQYGGFGISHSGFVLPESEIARVREELTDASVIAWYMMSGPASVRAIEIRRTDTGEVIFAGEWQTNYATERQWQETVNSGLESATEYQIWVAYNKPMRWLNDAQEPVIFGSSNPAIGPGLVLEGLDANNQGFRQQLLGEASDWLVTPGGPGVGYLTYKADAFMFNFTLDNTIDPASASLLALAFNNSDIAANVNDANPATVVDYNNHWQNYESTDGSQADSGGIDRMIRLIDNGSPLFTDPNAVIVTPPPATPEPSNDSGGGSMPPGVIFGMLVLYSLRRLRYYP